MRKPRRVIEKKSFKVKAVCPVCGKPYTIHAGSTTNGGPCRRCQEKGCK